MRDSDPDPFSRRLSPVACFSHSQLKVRAPKAERAVMGDARAQAKEQLATLIQRVMADNVIEPHEREELQAVYRQALLTVSDVRDVLGRYVRAVLDDVLADGKVTDDERKRCRAVVSELKIPPALLPQSFKAIIAS
jgi:uncharacterized tellurite resistance protein B-like protein